MIHPSAGFSGTTLRVLLIGDSLLAQPSCTIGAALAADGIETHMHAVSGSGLLTGAIDWKRRLDQLLASVHPDVVVALFSGNYPPPPVNDASGQPIAYDTPAFYAAWQDRAREISATVRAAGPKLFWLQPPPMVVSPIPPKLYAGYLQLGDATLASGRALADSAGRWVATRPECGTDGQPLRADDSVHMTDAGARVYGLVIAHDLAAALGRPTITAPC